MGTCAGFRWCRDPYATSTMRCSRSWPRSTCACRFIRFGFWPGDPWPGPIDALFYSYTLPAPAGLASQPARPDAAFFSDKLKEFLLPYKDVRRSADPAQAILDFAHSTYDAGSTLAGW